MPCRCDPSAGCLPGSNLSAAARERVQSACAHVFDSEQFRAMAKQLGVHAELVVGDRFARLLDAERIEMRALIDALGLQPR